MQKKLPFRPGFLINVFENMRDGAMIMDHGGKAFWYQQGETLWKRIKDYNITV